MGLLGEGRRVLSAEKRVQNPYAPPYSRKASQIGTPPYEALDFLAKVAALSRRRNGFETRMPHQYVGSADKHASACQNDPPVSCFTWGTVSRHPGPAEVPRRGHSNRLLPVADRGDGVRKLRPAVTFSSAFR